MIVLILTIAAIILFAIQLESLPKLDLKQKIEDGFEGFKFEVSTISSKSFLEMGEKLVDFLALSNS